MNLSRLWLKLGTELSILSIQMASIKEHAYRLPVYESKRYDEALKQYRELENRYQRIHSVRHHVGDRISKRFMQK